MKAKAYTMLLKACPRCRGDLIYDPCEKQRLCLQCGHRLSRQQEREIFGTAPKDATLGGKRPATATSNRSRSRPPVGVTAPV